MGSYSTQAAVDYGAFTPFNSQSYFHTPCGIDYSNDTSIKTCWLGDNNVALADLRTENSNVQTLWNTWIAKLVSDYTIDGLRIDTAYQINQGFWAGFQAAAGGIHTLGEVWNGDITVMCPYQNYLHGLLNYGYYYWITQAFQSTSGSITNLVNGINSMKSQCVDVTLMGAFLENHDNPRFPSLTSDIVLIRTAITFTMLADGIPIIYQGQEQRFSGSGVPANREALWLSGYNKSAELYLLIQKLNALRRTAINKANGYLVYNAWPIYSDSRTIVMRKGPAGNQIISAYTNRGASGASATITIAAANSGFTANQAVTEVLACVDGAADGQGNYGATFTGGKALVLYPTAALAGSGICGK